MRFVSALSALAVAGAVQAQTFDPRLHKRVAGQPTEVMVLGTPHLSGLPETFTPAALEPLLDRLAAWQPTVITIEAISGEQCDALRRYPARYKDSVEAYCWDPSPAARATGLDVPAATAEAERLLAEWPARPSAAQRRRLAAVFLAAGNRASALVQWLRLPPAERRAGDGLDAALATLLERQRARRNEDDLIAAVLAARLGLERVFPADDHSSDAPVADQAVSGRAIEAAWDNPATASRRAEDEALGAGLGSGEGVLRLYRAYNAPGYPQRVFASDFGAALAEPSPQGFGRGYVAAWEVRNLRMAANVREAAATRPGGRVLAIVGASHRGYFEAYLSMMHDMRLVPAATLLR
ncbi:DUF5694 domain-containing protein [Sphingomonas lenta]|uniref:TraB/GumN family protein n=1 Tax=Sphingomonas lenta TaxID=1141887 RepID=A0A2A2SDE9_9SPHN|nr:DUF5694 domain-containing protein [Sphingomonas lenta]PAX07279.1 hypothetical protein CKY28_14755 [Sphingomonas lenta]